MGRKMEKENKMEKINFDSGVKEYRLGAGVLKFNPGDPNLYARFLDGAEKLRQVERELTEQASGASDTEVLGLLMKADFRMKGVLNWIFGPGSDFNELLMGVNLLAVAHNGERVVTNLFATLEPILVGGAEQCASQLAGAAVEKAQARREAQ